MRKLVAISEDHLSLARRLRDYMNEGTEPRIVDGIEVPAWELPRVLSNALAKGLEEWSESASEDPTWSEGAR